MIIKGKFAEFRDKINNTNNKIIIKGKSEYNVRKN